VDVGKAEHVAQEILDEAQRGAARAHRSRDPLNIGLADAEVARDFVAQRQALRIP